MKYKKTFWMNVVIAIVWTLLCLFGNITDIDYEKHSNAQNAIRVFVQLFILATLIVTAIHLLKLKLQKFVLFSNYLSIILTIISLITTFYYQPSLLAGNELLFMICAYGIFIAPFVVNLEFLRRG
jgi:tryptophan-rich sensory protein